MKKEDEATEEEYENEEFRVTLRGENEFSFVMVVEACSADLALENVIEKHDFGELIMNQASAVLAG